MSKGCKEQWCQQQEKKDPIRSRRTTRRRSRSRRGPGAGAVCANVVRAINHTIS